MLNISEELFAKGTMISHDTFEIVRYHKSLMQAWDAYIQSTCNGHFLFLRNYMDYHSDRFRDHSLIFMQNERIVALMPACEENGVIFSHKGLTFGGLLYGPQTKASKVIAIFMFMVRYLKENGFSTLIYKPTPWMYHCMPAEADIYALYNLGAQITAMQLAVIIDYSRRYPYSELRRRSFKKASRASLVIRESSDWGTYMNMLNTLLLERHGVSAVHTAEEMLLLQTRFPRNIRLLVAEHSGQMLAGAVLYITDVVIHTQYLANSKTGMSLGALDLVLKEAIEFYADKKRYFCFGSCTDREGKSLNLGLLHQKETFGGQAVTYNHWALDLSCLSLE